MMLLQIPINKDKTMQELADAALKQVLDDTTADGVTIREWLEKIASGDYQPVKHGRWICEDLKDGFGKITCSCCGESISVSPYRYENLKEYEKFCPNCGTKMDGGDEE